MYSNNDIVKKTWQGDQKGCCIILKDCLNIYYLAYYTATQRIIVNKNKSWEKKKTWLIFISCHYTKIYDHRMLWLTDQKYVFQRAYLKYNISYIICLCIYYRHGSAELCWRCIPRCHMGCFAQWRRSWMVKENWLFIAEY